MNKEKAKKTIEACLNELYINSEPSITWKEVLNKYKDVIEFYMKHEIDDDVYDTIVAQYLKLLPKLYHNDLRWTLLDYAPTHKKNKSILHK
jgi:hypothetical protein